MKLSFENKGEIPPKQFGKKQIYGIRVAGYVVGIGETTNMLERVPNGYRWKIQSDLPDGSTVIDELKKIADIAGRENVFEFSTFFIEQVDHKDARPAEKKWIEHYRKLGEPIFNRT